MSNQALPIVGAACAAGQAEPLTLVPVRCCICESEDAEPIAVGEDFEYRTSPDTFLAMRCRGCGLVYLNPRPCAEDFDRIYPASYHAFDFSPKRFGLAFRMRQQLERRRVLSWCRGLGDGARILDVGCGDGFHLSLLRDFGKPGWELEGADLSTRAAAAARQRGLRVHHGSVQDLGLPRASYDLVLLIQTLEHVADPPGLLTAIRDLLRPGGRLVVVTDNVGSLDFRLFRGRHWGGYHFPRHWNLFSCSSLRALAGKVGLEVASLTACVSPVNWVYSIRNILVDRRAPRWLVECFSLRALLSLAAFTIGDRLLQLVGKGALLRAVLRRPATAPADAVSRNGVHP